MANLSFALSTRASAAEVVWRVMDRRQSLPAALQTVLTRTPQARDRAFVRSLSYSTVRWYHRLDYILDRLLHKPLKHAEVRALALVGLCQIAFSRVKAHAAVAETVRAGARWPWAKPLLNAVLRGYQRNRDALDALADAADVSATAHPAWLLEAIRRNWPGQAAAILKENNEQPPMTLRVNRRRCTRDRYIKLLQEAAIEAAPVSFCDSAVVLATPMEAEALPGFADGLVSVQDAAAQLAAPLLDVNAGQRVLDVCAAPGGKTGHILELCPRVAALTAVDVVAERVERIRENLARLELSADIVTGDATRPAAWWDGRGFDRILLDAPCSATGVIRRHPDIKLLRKAEDVAAVCELQQRLLRNLWPLLLPGGVMLYATCSVLREENEAQIEAFLQSQGDARELPIEAAWGVAGMHGRQILTGERGMDGFYYARLAKVQSPRRLSENSLIRI